jgi:hypothetical protein
MSEEKQNKDLTSAPAEADVTKKKATKFHTAKREFIRWLATPEALRIPNTQREFAASRNVNESTVSVWKGRPEVEREVRRLVCADSSLEIADVLAALKRAARAGSVPAIRLFLEFVLNWRDDASAVIVENEISVSFGDEVGFWNKKPDTGDSNEITVSDEPRL